MCLEKPDGRTITYKYDALDNQIQKDMDGNTFVYSYNKDNQVTNITKNNNLDTKITYNQFGDMTEVKQPNGTVKYQYDEIGRRVGLTYADGTKTTYEYDKNDNLLSTSTNKLVTSYQYDAIGNVTQKTLPNGTVTNYSYNDNNQIATTKTMTSLGTILTNMEYVYDERGNIVSEKETVDGKTTDKTYTYDEEERLASSVHTTGLDKKEYAYGYDMVGNKTSMSETTNGKITSRQYQFDSNNALTNDNGAKYEYDNNGNVSKKIYKNGVVETFKYDSEGQLIETNSSIGKTITYNYDGLGNRTQKVEKTTIEQSEGSSFLSFLKNDNTYNEEYDQQLVSQTTNEQLTNLHQTISDPLDTFNQTCPVDDEDGPKTSVTTINYINDINRPYTEVLQTKNKNSQTVHTYIYGNERLSDIKRGENTNYYAYDGKGSVVGQETATNKVALSFKVSYNDFGQPNRKMDNQYGYNGESHDYNGTQYLRARYYDTKTGTFGQQDSYMGDNETPISQNRFVYTHNNPINNIDPSGHAAKKAPKKIAGQPSGKMCLDSKGNLYNCDDTRSISKPGYQTSSGLSGGGTTETYTKYEQYWQDQLDDPNSYYYDMMVATEQRRKEREAEIQNLKSEINADGVILDNDLLNSMTEWELLEYLRALKKMCDDMKTGKVDINTVQAIANSLTPSNLASQLSYFSSYNKLSDLGIVFDPGFYKADLQFQKDFMNFVAQYTGRVYAGIMTPEEYYQQGRAYLLNQGFMNVMDFISLNHGGVEGEASLSDKEAKYGYYAKFSDDLTTANWDAILSIGDWKNIIGIYSESETRYNYADGYAGFGNSGVEFGAGAGPQKTSESFGIVVFGITISVDVEAIFGVDGKLKIGLDKGKYKILISGALGQGGTIGIGFYD